MTGAVRSVALALSLLLPTAAYGQDEKPKAEPDKKLVLTIAADRDLNDGRPLHAIVRAVTLKAFAEDSYATVADLVVDPDESVVERFIIYPGSDRRIVVEPPEKPSSIAIYFLFTDPTTSSKSWKRFYQDVPAALDVELARDRVASMNRPTPASPPAGDPPAGNDPPAGDDPPATDDKPVEKNDATWRFAIDPGTSGGFRLEDSVAFSYAPLHLWGAGDYYLSPQFSLGIDVRLSLLPKADDEIINEVAGFVHIRYATQPSGDGLFFTGALGGGVISQEADVGIKQLFLGGGIGYARSLVGPLGFSADARLILGFPILDVFGSDSFVDSLSEGFGMQLDLNLGLFVAF